MNPKGQDRDKRAEEFGQWMAARRNTHRLSQSAAARLADVDRSTWIRLENGGLTPKVQTKILVGIAGALEVTPEEVFKRAGVPTPPLEPLVPMVRAENPEGVEVLARLQETLAQVTEALESVMRQQGATPRPPDKPPGAPKRGRGAGRPRREEP